MKKAEEIFVGLMYQKPGWTLLYTKEQKPFVRVMMMPGLPVW